MCETGAKRQSVQKQFYSLLFVIPNKNRGRNTCSAHGPLFLITQNPSTHHSYFKAVTGTSVAARSAGYSPEISPTIVAKISANSGSQAGVTAVLGVGSDPGMSNVICRAVADELEEIDSINLYWAAELVGPENPVLVPPYSLSTVLAEYARPSTQFLDGRHVECAPMTGREHLDLPEPWGRCEFMYSPHSEQLTVPLAQGIRDKGIKEFTWKLHLPHREHEAWVGLVKAGFGDFDEQVEVGGRPVKPLDVLQAVIARNIERNGDRIPAQDSHEIHLAIGRGRIGGAPATVRCEVVVRPDPLYAAYVDAATSMNASIAAQLILAHPKKPGVYAPEEYFSVASYFPELEKRNFAVRLQIRRQ